MSNFINDCLTGDAFLSDIDDYIHAWHIGNSELSLHEYLGMTFDEYAGYVENEDLLPFIVTAHKRKIDFRSFAKNEISMAARSDDAGKAALLKDWLISRGLWD